jgi:cell division protein FtsB
MVFPIVNGDFLRIAGKHPLIKVMGILKYLIALWAAVAVYSISSVFVGASGLTAYKQLTAERDKQRANTEALQNLNQELEGTLDALKYDSDTIRVYARELGYGTPRERFVRIVGLPGVKKQRMTAGQVTISQKPDFIPDQTLRIYSIFAGLGVFILLCLYESSVSFINRRYTR